MHFRLLGLPEEIQLNVLLNISSHRDILHCSQTCIHLHRLIAASGAVQYRIQLGRYGMVEGIGASTQQQSSEERSRILRETIERRRTFNPTFIHDLGPVEADHGRAFDLLDGIYARLTHEPVNPSVPEPEGEIVARLTIKDISGDCSKPVKTTQLDVFPTDIAISPSLDLVVLLVPEATSPTAGSLLTLYLRTLSSGGIQDHPDARKPVLQCLNRIYEGFLLEQDFYLSIDEDVLALHVIECSFDVFRWSTGRHILSWGHRIVPTVTLLGFSLISRTCFMVGHSQKFSPGCLALYRIPSADWPDDEDVQIQVGEPHVELLLPNIYEEQNTIVTGIFTSPPRSSKGAFDEASRITVAQLTVEEARRAGLPEGDLKDVTLVFLRDYFVGVCNRHLHEAQALEAVKVPWDDWGPFNSRLLDLAIDSFPDKSVCSGSRLIYRRFIDDWESMLSDSDESFAYPFYYLDFGDVHDAEFLEIASRGDATAGQQASRVMGAGGGQLAHNIYTYLPYYAVETRRETFDLSTILMDGDRIICSRPLEDGGWDLEYGGRTIEHVCQL